MSRSGLDAEQGTKMGQVEPFEGRGIYFSCCGEEVWIQKPVLNLEIALASNRDKFPNLRFANEKGIDVQFFKTKFGSRPSFESRETLNRNFVVLM